MMMRRALGAGWRPATVWGLASGVVRELRRGDSYDHRTDSLIRVPLRHAKDWREACLMDGI